MSHVSRDNADLSGRVARIRAGYAQFETTLRGAVVELLAGLGSGVYTMMTMNQVVERVGQSYLSTSRQEVLEDLGKLSESALETSQALSSELITPKALSVAEALHRGFAAEIESVIERAVARDVRTALDFVRQQLVAGRFTATSDQLTHDLVFNFTGKMTIPTVEYVGREVNWAYRQQYNTIMVHVLLAREVEEAQVDGGSKDGDVIDLMQYDQVQGKYFHHNSKSLLQPLDVGI
uniref:Uncharacterized protein n=1 Tax=Pseudomonas phage Nican01 TaxID=3138540 RepID=A0AAU6W0E8_9CAUD